MSHDTETHQAAAAHPAVREAHADAEGIRIVRVMPAPPQLVYEAWTTPEHFGQWFGEYGSELADVSMDVRPGGKWTSTMLVTEPQEMRLPFFGTYVEVDPPHHLALTLEDPEGSDAVETLTVDLTDLGDGTTEMVFTQTGGNLPADEYPRAMAGELVFFQRLGELLERLAG
ncbi:MAG: hypothetical protein QOE97_663 [Pseudonocardiales bacterium]|jgi:uncharacterized protein YndB with AHSA1/START domain|nr:hypothetical protein [Pseudonocardiales bacterium]